VFISLLQVFLRNTKAEKSKVNAAAQKLSKHLLKKREFEKGFYCKKTCYFIQNG
jgi:hypothetical protein